MMHLDIIENNVNRYRVNRGRFISVSFVLENYIKKVSKLKSIDALNRKMTKERVKDQIAKQLPKLQLDEAALKEIAVPESCQ